MKNINDLFIFKNNFLIIKQNIMLRPWWFNELSIEDQKIFDWIVNIIKKNYKAFWYDHIHTPAVERNEVLTAKSWEDASKQIFWLYWLAQWIDDAKSYSLHFDLTIPLARYVLDWQDKLTFPFKRYQIQTVWRWERQQRWRFKEFFQADVDVIWKDEDIKNNKSKFLYYDAELAYIAWSTIKDIFDFTKIEDEVTININNRKILWSYIDNICKWDENKKNKLISIIDKYYKIWEDKFKEEIKELWFTKNETNKINDFLTVERNKEDLLKLIDFIKSETFNDWINELYYVVNEIDKLSEWFNNKIKYKINFLIVRWLDYYTWTVYETFSEKDIGIWSLCSGWRYEWLTKHINSKSNFSWVWISIWVDRLMSLISEKETKENINIEKKLMIVNFQDNIENIYRLWSKLINNYNIEIYPKADNIKKQLTYANKKWLKYVVIYWEKEFLNKEYLIKDLELWTSKIVKI